MGEISQLLAFPELKSSLNNRLPTCRETRTERGLFPACGELRTALPLYCPMVKLVLLIFTVAVLGAVPLAGLTLIQLESPLPFQFMIPEPPLVIVMFWPAGLSEVAPKKFNDAGVETRITGCGDTVKVTETEIGEFCAPLENIWMIPL